MGIATCEVPEFASLAAVIERLAANSDVLLIFRAPVAEQVVDLARRVAPLTPILLHTVDLHFLRMHREATLSGDEAAAAIAMEMRATELNLIARVDATIVVSSYEKELLDNLVPGAKVHHIPIIREVPQLPAAPGWRGLLERSLARLRGRDNAATDHLVWTFEKRRDLLFIGNYLHQPNVDAVLWFARAVWPRVLAHGFRDRLIIAGPYAPATISGLASDRIKILGHVGDLGSLFAACRLSVAPLRYGGGAKGKIVTSLSYGVPVVATTLAIEGMGLTPENDVLVADTPDRLADQIVRLYSDSFLWQQLSTAGYKTFASTFSEAASAPTLLALLDSFVAPTPRRGIGRLISFARAARARQTGSCGRRASGNSDHH